MSHDRKFLNTICTDIVHLHTRRLEHYKGNYDQFEKVGVFLLIIENIPDGTEDIFFNMRKDIEMKILEYQTSFLSYLSTRDND